jgi:hypothetical protein
MGIAAERLPPTDMEGTMDNNEIPVRTDSPLELFEAAAVAALRAGYTIDDLTPWLLSAIDTVVNTPVDTPGD